MICNIYTFEDYLPDVSLLEKETLRGIIPYLTASHQYYLQERIPHIEHHLQRIVHLSESSQGRILLTFFEDYKNEVCSHFAYEENVVFPYISHLTSREKQDSYHFEDSHETHGDIEDKLNDLTLLILKYFPSNITTNDPYSVVLDVFRLSADLNRHALIEDKLLAPYVRHLEREEERG